MPVTASLCEVVSALLIFERAEEVVVFEEEEEDDGLPIDVPEEIGVPEMVGR